MLHKANKSLDLHITIIIYLWENHWLGCLIGQVCIIFIWLALRQLLPIWSPRWPIHRHCISQVVALLVNSLYVTLHTVLIYLLILDIKSNLVSMRQCDETSLCRNSSTFKYLIKKSTSSWALILQSQEIRQLKS